MREALATAGRQPLWVAHPGEGHGGYRLQTRPDFAQPPEDFLVQPLKFRPPGRAPMDSAPGGADT